MNIRHYAKNEFEVCTIMRFSVYVIMRKLMLCIFGIMRFLGIRQHAF